MADVSSPLEHPLFRDHGEALDRYEALLVEDQAQRDAEYARPDASRRRLKIACNDCTAPWCCYQHVDATLVEALVLYRWASTHAPGALQAALARGRALEKDPPADDAAHFRRKLPCPFLVGGRCAVYPVRPHRCRSHYMAGPPKLCREELAPRDTYGMSPDPKLLEELSQLGSDLAFFAQVEDVAVSELSRLLRLVDQVARSGVTWSRPVRLEAGLVPKGR